eukprot:jgi/Botrbrau1/4639/Bobra.33_2s0010.2
MFSSQKASYFACSYARGSLSACHRTEWIPSRFHVESLEESLHRNVVICLNRHDELQATRSTGGRRIYAASPLIRYGRLLDRRAIRAFGFQMVKQKGW